MQGDAEWRATPENLASWFVKGSSGNMASIASFTSFKWTTGPQMLQRFNGLPAVQFQGNAAAGTSSGHALDLMEEMIAEMPGLGLQWSGLSFQEKASSVQTLWIYMASLIFIFSVLLHCMKTGQFHWRSC